MSRVRAEHALLGERVRMAYKDQGINPKQSYAVPHYSTHPIFSTH